MNKVPSGIVEGEILPLGEFMRKTQMKRAAWSALMRRAAAAGCDIAYRDGRQVYVDTSAWISLLRAKKHARPKKSGEGSVSGDRSSIIDAECS
jgi:hypothetical protein